MLFSLYYYFYYYNYNNYYYYHHQHEQRGGRWELREDKRVEAAGHIRERSSLWLGRIGVKIEERRGGDG